MKVCLYCQTAFESKEWQCPTCSRIPTRICGYPAFAPEFAAENDGYDPERFAEIAHIDNEHFLRKARNRIFTWALGRYFPDAQRFLEIGCGIGVVLKALRDAYPEIDLWGSDIYSAGLSSIAEHVSGVNLFQVDARRIPFQNEFDVIGAFDVLEHIDEDVAVLKEIYKALKSGGGIMVSVPQHPFLWSQRDEAVCHKRRYTRRELITKVQEAGIEVVRTTSFITLPFPVMALAALRNRRRRKGYDPFAELKIGRTASSILNSLLWMERGLIAAGVDLPFGGTLFLVGRRSS
jgi:SAM-dependent methyltransferase